MNEPQTPIRGANIMKPDLADGITMVGAGCVVAGLWWMHPGLGLVMLGMVLVVTGYEMAKRRKG